MPVNRKPIIAGNWKMNTNVQEGLNLILNIQDLLNEIPEKDKALADIIICPPFITLKKAKEVLECNILLGAQNIFWAEKGAYTGEISPPMLKNLVEYVIIGHSERRQFFNETDEIINKKLKSALSFGLKPIFCIGETSAVRSQKKQNEFILKQLVMGLKDLNNQNISELIIAYEPTWAIGTGKAARPEDAQQIIAFIRKQISELFSDNFSQKIRILYGGSSNANNISGFIKKPDIDGVLAGGASLNAKEFVNMLIKIIKTQR